MKDDLNSEFWALDAGRLMVRTGLDGHALLCAEGSIWLTEEGFAEDVVLQAGDCYFVRGSGKLLLEAGAAAAIRVLRHVRAEQADLAA